MNRQTALSTVSAFFLTKIIIGIATVVALVVCTEWSARSLLDNAKLSDYSKNVIVAILDAGIALAVYIFLSRVYEKRQIKELSLSGFGKNALLGFSTGLVLQALFIVVMYMAGAYSVIQLNPVSFLLPSFATALTAGFVAEILIRGIFFRLMEEKLGTVITILILVLLFALLHGNAAGATILSVLTTAIQAGFLVSAVYVFTRSLWSTIFLHFAWDFVEPGVFGGINPGNSIQESLFTSKITGPAFLTGGQMGPQNSIEGFIFCSVTGLLFVWLAKQKNNFIKPYWHKTATS